MTLRRFLNLSNFPPRILPAYAGSTGVNTAGAGFSGDHPRVCGEHVDGFLRRLALLESSPRMRRAPGSCHERTAPTGIIPAYAGSTSASTETRKTCRDHPRVCGEHTGSLPRGSEKWGSSPRMRGARSRIGRAIDISGIIPAYAGSTGPVTKP